MLKLMVRGTAGQPQRFWDQAVVVADNADEDDYRRWGFVAANNQPDQEELQPRHEKRMEHEQDITEAL